MAVLEQQIEKQNEAAAGKKPRVATVSTGDRAAEETNKVKFGQSRSEQITRAGLFRNMAVNSVIQ